MVGGCHLRRAEIEHPARNEAAENGNVGDNDGNIVFNVIDAIVNRVSPVRHVDDVQAVTVGEVDLRSANTCHTACM